jgi:hypothetical protein
MAMFAALNACAAPAEDPSVFTTPLKPVKPASNPYLLRFMSAKFQLVHRTARVDPAVMTIVQPSAGAERMAELGERVQFSDVVGPEKLPWHRFVLAGHSDDVWFVVYFEGGFAPMNKFVLLSRDRGKWRVVFAGDLPYKTSTLEQIRRTIRNDGLYVNPTDHRYQIGLTNRCSQPLTGWKICT